MSDVLLGYQLRALVLLHAELLAREERKRTEAERLDRLHEPERAEMARDDGADLEFKADALGKLLGLHGVHIPDPNQLSLLSLGTAP